MSDRRSVDELAWRRLEQRMAADHAAGDPPLPPELWRGVAARIAAPRPQSRSTGRLALGAIVLAAAAGVALWYLPPRAGSVQATAPTAERIAAGSAPDEPAIPATTASTPVPSSVPPPPPPPAVSRPPLNQVLETEGPVTVVITSDAGRIEVEPCRGRFVNVTVLDSSHRRLALRQRARRVDVAFDGGALADGVAHVLVPSDTHLVISTKRGDVIVRGLGGPLEVDTQSGAIRVDSAPRLAPSVQLTSESGDLHWQGLCTGRCRIEATSRSGNITLRSADPSAFTRGSARASSESGRIHLEELTCSDPRCSSPPLPWRSGAAHP